MSQQDRLGFNNVSTNLQYLRAIRRWLFGSVRFHETHLRSDCHWSAQSLAFAAILWAWAEPFTLVGRFALVMKINARLFRNSPIDVSYQSFVKLLGKHTESLAAPIIACLRKRMQTDFKQHFTLYDRAVFAVDGTKILLPKTKSNEKAYAKTRKRKQTRRGVGAKTKSGHLRNKVPQFYATMMWNMGTQLLWDWRAGPSNASESEHLEEMIESLPDQSVVVADAGFIGYDLWNKILGGGHHLVVRVGANVKLLRKLGFTRENKSTVCYWPIEKRKAGLPPFIFRMLVITGGKHPVYLLTNLKVSELTNTQLAELYRRRWGIEVHYRTLKCTFGRGKLRSYNSQNAASELTWSIIGLWAANQIALAQSGLAPDRISMAGVIRSLQLTMTHYRVRPEDDEDLQANLRRSKIDDYHRDKKSCRHPTILTQNYRASRKPNIVNASPAELRKVAKLKAQAKQLRLTA